MTRLLIHVEGQTEEGFVNEVLAPHLYQHGLTQVSARIVGNARLRTRRGGIKGWESVRDDISRHLKQDSGCYASTMVDFYALPATGDKAWPGRAEASGLPHDQKSISLEQALLQDLRQIAGEGPGSRFIPYVVMHEFEALLFSDCEAFATGIGRPSLTESFQKIRLQFATPEHINDSPSTAPSKRVEGLVAGYQKPLMGAIAALSIGLPAIRNQCPGFESWITKLEGIGKA